MGLRLFILAFLLALPGEACEPSACHGGLFLHSDASLPANIAGIAWWQSGRLAEFVLERQTGKRWAPIPTTVLPERPKSSVSLVSPKSRKKFQVGTYRLTAKRGYCSDQEAFAGSPGPITIHIRPAAPKPAGALILSAAAPVVGTVRVATSVGSCSTVVSGSQVVVSAALPSNAQPWRDALLWRTTVDDKPWRPSPSLPVWVPPGQSWQGRGKDLLYTSCAKSAPPARRLEPGKHKVQMFARLPGTPIELASNVLTIELPCK